MANATTADFPTARASFDAYCARHAIGPDTAIAELVHLAIDQGLLRVGDRMVCEA